MIGGSNIIAFFIRDPEECQNVVPNPFCSPDCVQDTTICVGHPGSQLLQNIRKLSEAVSSRSHADPRTHRGTRDRAYWSPLVFNPKLQRDETFPPAACRSRVGCWPARCRPNTQSEVAEGDPLHFHLACVLQHRKKLQGLASAGGSRAAWFPES